MSKLVEFELGLRRRSGGFASATSLWPCPRLTAGDLSCGADDNKYSALYPGISAIRTVRDPSAPASATRGRDNARGHSYSGLKCLMDRRNIKPRDRRL